MDSFMQRMVGLALCLAFGFGISGCSPFDSRAKTPKEFVKKYAQAYSEGDVETILKMTDRIKDQSDDTLRSAIQDDIERHGFNYQAWTHTHYQSEKDLGKCIKVDVRVDEAVTAIYLVRVGDTLKVSQTPGDFEP